MKLSLHHVTVLGRKPQRTFDFYVKKLGFDLVWEGTCQDNEATPQHDFKLPYDDVLLTFHFYPRCHKGEKGCGLFGGLVLGLPGRDWKKELGRFYRGRGRENGRHIVVDPDGLQIEIEETEAPGVLGLQVPCPEVSKEKEFWRGFPGLVGGGHSLNFMKCEGSGVLGYGSIHHGAVLCEDLVGLAESSPARATRWGVSSYIHSPSDVLIERVSLPAGVQPFGRPE